MLASNTERRRRKLSLHLNYLDEILSQIASDDELLVTDHQTDDCGVFDMTAEPKVLKTDLILLDKVRAYLEEQLQDRIPDTRLELAWEEFYRLYADLAPGYEPGDTQQNPAMLFERRWEKALLQSVVAGMRSELSSTNYRILRMRAFEHRDTKEVANPLNVSPEQVRYRYHRVMKKLKAHVALITAEAA